MAENPEEFIEEEAIEEAPAEMEEPIVDDLALMEEEPVETAEPAIAPEEPEIPEQPGEEPPAPEGGDGLVKVTFLDDGDDLEMDFALAGFRGTKMYPRRVKDPLNAPVQSLQPDWMPEFGLIDLMAMEPSSHFFSPRRNPEFAEANRQQIAERRARQRQQAIESVRPKSMIERVTGMFRRVITGRHFGPGPHPGTGTGQEVHGNEEAAERETGTGRRGGGGGGGSRGGGVERPAHVGASVKLLELSKPQTVIKKNSANLPAWIQARNDSRKWGTDQETGEMIDDNSWGIGSGVIDEAIDTIQEMVSEQQRTQIAEAMGDVALEDLEAVDWVDPDSGEAYGEINEWRVQQYVDDLINGDIDNEQYEVERYVEQMVETAETQLGLNNANWETIAEAVGKTQDELQGMSNAEIDHLIQQKVFESVVEAARVGPGEGATEEQEAIVAGIEAYVLSYINNTYDEGDDYEIGSNMSASEEINYEVGSTIADYYSENPHGYDFDYLVDELDVHPGELRDGPLDLDEAYQEALESGEIDIESAMENFEQLGLPETFTNSYYDFYYGALPDTGEIVAVMQTKDKTITLSDQQKQEIASRFGIDPSEVGDDYIYIDMLAAKYPRHGYGTELILEALKDAHEKDRGITGSAAMGAAMFYAKLGAQYLSDVGTTEGGQAFWTNAQVHAAYNWLTSQLEAIKSGELSVEQIETEQTQAETEFKPGGQTDVPETRWTGPGTAEFVPPGGEGRQSARVGAGRGAFTIQTGGAELEVSRPGQGLLRELMPDAEYMVFEHPDQETPVVAVQTQDSMRPNDVVWEILGAGGTAWYDEDSLMRAMGEAGLTNVSVGGSVGSEDFRRVLNRVEDNNNYSETHLAIDNARLWQEGVWEPAPVEMARSGRALYYGGGPDAQGGNRTRVRALGTDGRFNIVRIGERQGNQLLVMNVLDDEGENGFQIVGTINGLPLRDEVHRTYEDAINYLEEWYEGDVSPASDQGLDEPYNFGASGFENRKFAHALANLTVAQGNVSAARDVIANWLRDQGREREVAAFMLDTELQNFVSGGEEFQRFAEAATAASTAGAFRRAPDPKKGEALRRLAELVELEPAVLFIPKEGGDPRLAERHFGPGPHPGTGTPQEVHGNEEAAGDPSKLMAKRPKLLGKEITLEKLRKVKANPLEIRSNDFSDPQLYKDLEEQSRLWSNSTAGGFALQIARLAQRYLRWKSGETLEEQRTAWREAVKGLHEQFMGEAETATPNTDSKSTEEMAEYFGLDEGKVDYMRSEGTLQEWVHILYAGRSLAASQGGELTQRGKEIWQMFRGALERNYSMSKNYVEGYGKELFFDAYDFHVVSQPGLGDDATAQAIDEGKYKIHIGMIGDEIVSVADTDFDEGLLTDGATLYVNSLGSKYPGHGHGTQMMLKVLEEAYNRDASIEGYSLSQALPFYQKLVASIMRADVTIDRDSVVNAYTWLQAAYDLLEDTSDESLPGLIQPSMPFPQEVPEKPTPEQMEPVVVAERHLGPGPHPSGSSQDVHAGGAGGAGKKTVGITSARPGKPSRSVFEDMRGFSDKLSKIKTVQNVNVQPGLGGWEGGREPTWVVSYEGNGAALKLLAETAKEYEQEAVLLTREGGNSIQTDFTFTDPVTPEERSTVEQLLVDMGIGGWTWYRTPGGGSTLRAVAVPQWGGNPREHVTMAKKLRQMFEAVDMPHEYSESAVDVDIMEREGQNAYDKILS